MLAEFISPSDKRWTDLLSSAPHDIYQRPEYVLASAECEGGTPVAFFCEEQGEKFLVPLLARQIPAGLGAPAGCQDLITPYGYPAPIFYPGNNLAKLGEFMEVFFYACRCRNMVSAFIRLHPLLPLPLGTLGKYGALVKHGETVFIDLSLDADEIWGQRRENHKRDIKKLYKQGFTAEMDQWSYYDKFQELYLESMKRLKAGSFYYFSKKYFEELKIKLKSELHLCTVISPKGDMAAAGLFTETRDIIEYHLGATNEEYLKNSPSKILFDFMTKWGIGRRIKIFHLGGGLEGNRDSLFNFKSGFSQLRGTFYSYRMIFDPQIYEFLAKTKIIGLEKESKYLGYFPLYRVNSDPDSVFNDTE